MAKKTKTTEVLQEAVTPLKMENVNLETVNIKEAKAEPIKKRIIIAHVSVPLRKTTSLDVKHIVGKMAVGTAYEIKRECTSKIYGDFYQLTNGYYISKSEYSSNYSIF